MKKEILIDDRTFSLQQKGGVSQLWAKLLFEFSKSDDFSYVLFLSLGWEKNIHLNEVWDKVADKLLIIKSSIPPSDNFNYNAESDAELRIKEIDNHCANPFLVINTYYGENVYPSCKKYLVVSHDFAHEELAILASKDSTRGVIERKKTSYKVATCNVFVSSATRSRGLLLYPQIKDHRNIVILHGHDDYFPKINKYKNTYIHVGTRSGYKNFHTILDAFSNFLAHQPKAKLLIAGGEAPDAELINFMKKFPSQTEFHQGVTDAEMDQLVASVEYFISASEYEGFGIPVLNALRLKTIPILSNIQIYREIAASNAYFFSCKNSMELLELLNNKVQSINSHHNIQRSWKDVANEYQLEFKRLMHD